MCWGKLRLQYTGCFSEPRFTLRVSLNIDGQQTKNIVRLNICVNETVLYGPYVADVKGKQRLTAIARKEACPRDEMGDSPGTNVLSIYRYVFVGQGDDRLSYRVE